MIFENQTSFRNRSLRETLKILHQYKSQAGITRLADITNLDYVGLPVFTAIRPTAKSLSTSQGKGITKQSAQCSALMEAIEVYFAETLTPQITNKSIHDLNIANQAYISPNNINKTTTFLCHKETMSWVLAHSIISGKPILVPFAEFSLNSYLKEVLIYSPDTTGLSGGNTYQEALLHSLLEIIEREFSITEFDVLNIENNLFKKINKHFACKVVYKKNLFNMPSFEVLLKPNNTYEPHLIFKGNGCHLRKKIALNRAVTEALQSRLTLIAGSRDDILNSTYENSNINWQPNIYSCNFDDLSEYLINSIDESINIICDSAIKNKLDIVVFKYYEKDICVLKSKILPMDFINYA